MKKNYIKKIMLCLAINFASDVSIAHGTQEWLRSYGVIVDSSHASSIQQTSDGGYIVAGLTAKAFGFISEDIGVLKLNSNGEITNCDIAVEGGAQVSDSAITGTDTEAIVQLTNLTITIPDFISHSSLPDALNLCCYDTVSDFDGDGSGDICDNCPYDPNANQADNYPPLGNSCGDDCECEGNFDSDSDQDGSDAAQFKIDFGRSLAFYPCDDLNPCHGDFACDGDVDGSDAVLFKQDFGRSRFSNPCFPCVGQVRWCSYPLP